MWNQFYQQVDKKIVHLTRENFLQKANEIDAIFGYLFNSQI